MGVGGAWFPVSPQGYRGVTAGARVLDRCEACHLFLLVVALPESHRAFWNLSEGMPFCFCSVGFGDQIASVPLPLCLDFRFRFQACVQEYVTHSWSPEGSFGSALWWVNIFKLII